jgi:mRNA-degrading endonuclease YafQ of YafQ-DinJ toxin-antitoxin module
MKKINATNSFLKKLEKLEKKNVYSIEEFKKDIDLFLKDELNPKFRKHKLNWFDKDVFSVSLWYDLRALYFFVKEDKKGNLEYLFFDIANHDEVY